MAPLDDPCDDFDGAFNERGALERGRHIFLRRRDAPIGGTDHTERAVPPGREHAAGDSGDYRTGVSRARRRSKPPDEGARAAGGAGRSGDTHATAATSAGPASSKRRGGRTRRPETNSPGTNIFEQLLPPEGGESEAYREVARRAAERLVGAKTTKGYRAARAQWAAFATELKLFGLAPSRDIVKNGRLMALFVTWLFDRKARGKSYTLAPSTVRNYASGVAHWWRLELQRAPLPKQCLSALIMKAGAAQEARPPRVRNPIDGRFFAALKKIKCPIHVRCAISFAYVHFMRAGEYSRSGLDDDNDKYILRNKDVVPTESGGGTRVTQGFRKNNSSGMPHSSTSNKSELFPEACPTTLWAEYNRGRPKAHKAPDGYAFTNQRGRLVTRREVAAWIKKAAASLGLNKDDFSTHSCRIGGATAAWRAKMPVTWIMQRGFWSTLAGILPYLRRHADDDAHATDIFLGCGMAKPLSSKEQAEELLRLEQESNDDRSSNPRALDSEDDDDSDDDSAPSDSDSD